MASSDLPKYPVGSDVPGGYRARSLPPPCPECRGEELYMTCIPSGVTAKGGSFDLLPGLGGIFSYARLDVVVCARCGFTRFYADEAARAQMADAKGWQKS
jgi:hypothetical protein